jgi:UPF0042 nucleotide-binding protein
MGHVKVISFSYRNGHPPSADGWLVMDCRRMRNPHNVPALRDLNGTDSAVQDYVRNDPAFTMLLDEAIREAAYGGKIAFGCYGGRHRSVAMAEMTTAALRAAGYEVEKEHQALVLA